jgi:ubiquinol-cytochrome c reductase cytochrome b subunit
VHIQPEWYFLFAYTILRSIPSKLGGVVCLALSILVLLAIPAKKSSKKFSLWGKCNLWTAVAVVRILTWIGTKPVETPIVEIGQVFRILYFAVIVTF